MPKTLKTQVKELAYLTFLDISVQLTGFNMNELLSTGMHETYYYTIMKDPNQDNVRAFFNEAQKILDDCGIDEKCLHNEIGNRLIPEDKFEMLAKRIILVWYTGMWNELGKDEKGKPVLIGTMISGDSYSEGLIWSAAETHPAGAKQPGYGSWAIAPLP
ncbi:MAG: hypothetical protein ABIN01_20570 [Ferruginibacter sp.]